MNDYYEARFTFEPCNEDITDLASACLADAGFESFMADPEGLTAWRPASLGSLPPVNELLAEMPILAKATMESTFVEGRDWNAEWERNYFKPIVIAGECVVHSSFHTGIAPAQYEIVIDPKMAFGTGHHATTEMMMRRLLDTEVRGRKVIDVGTGTGILAILAAMRGASPVIGIEIDEFAHANAVENVRLNHHPEIEIVLGDARALPDDGSADLLLANINRNIITSDISRYSKALRKGGKMYLSGFYESDIEIIRAAGDAVEMAFENSTSIGDWASVCLYKK